MDATGPRPPAPSPGRWAWLCVTYLASGLPFGIVLGGLLSVHMARLNVREQDAGLVTLFALPWALKVFWAPFVDRFGGRRVWIVGCLVALAVVVAMYAQAVATLPVVERGAAAAAPTIAFPVLGWVAVVLITALSATQDVAIDARAVETFPGREAGPAAGVKVGVYRVAILVAGGLLVGLAPRWGWDGVFFAAAGLLGALGVACLFLPAVPRPPIGPMSIWEPLLRLLRRPGFTGVAFFVLLYKVGDATLSPMATQFLARANGLHWTDGAMATFKTLSIVTAIVGGLVGGYLTKRWGVYRSLWILGGLQAASNLVYAAAAWSRTDAMGWTAVLAESLCAGLGTAPFVALFMISCERGLEGPQYALLSSIFAPASAPAGAFSGYGVHAMGWAPYFALTFLVAAPAFALLPWVKRWLRAIALAG